MSSNFKYPGSVQLFGGSHAGLNLPVKGLFILSSAAQWASMNNGNDDYTQKDAFKILFFEEKK